MYVCDISINIEHTAHWSGTMGPLSQPPFISVKLYPEGVYSTWLLFLFIKKCECPEWWKEEYLFSCMSSLKMGWFPAEREKRAAILGGCFNSGSIPGWLSPCASLWEEVSAGDYMIPTGIIWSQHSSIALWNLCLHPAEELLWGPVKGEHTADTQDPNMLGPWPSLDWARVELGLPMEMPNSPVITRLGRACLGEGCQLSPLPFSLTILSPLCSLPIFSLRCGLVFSFQGIFCTEECFQWVEALIAK